MKLFGRKQEKALVETLPQGRERLSRDKILEAFDLLGITKKLDETQKNLFLAVAQEFQLNPLRREIHAVSMGGEDGESKTLVPVVGYEVYVDRAEETGRLEYWFIEEAGEIRDDWKKSDYRVTVVIKRRDWPKDFRWTARFAEAVGLRYNKAQQTLQPNSMWRKRGHFMTQKCAIGQGFRLCFRDILRGMPYIDAEVENADNGHDEQPEDMGELRAPQALIVRPVESDPPAPETNLYPEIMQALNTTEASPEGPRVPVFSTSLRQAWKERADGARGTPAQLAALLEELFGAIEDRRRKIRGEG